MSGNVLREGQYEEYTSVDMEAKTARLALVTSAFDIIQSVVLPVVDAVARPSIEHPVQFTEQYPSGSAPDLNAQPETSPSPAERNLTLINNEDFVPTETAIEAPNLRLVNQPYQTLDGTEVFTGGPKADGMGYEVNIDADQARMDVLDAQSQSAIETPQIIDNSERAA